MLIINNLLKPVDYDFGGIQHINGLLVLKQTWIAIIIFYQRINTRQKK